MFKGHFYNSAIRKYEILMGNLFSNILVKRQKGDGHVYRRVPITKASKEAFVRKLESRLSKQNQDGKPEADLANILPRMSLELTDLSYDENRKTSKLNKNKVSSNGKLYGVYNPVPWNFTFTISVWTRYQDDVYQIIEQILPYFQPIYTAKMKETVGEVSYDREIPISLASVIPMEDYEFGKDSMRRVEWQLVFILNGWLYPPQNVLKGEIKTVFIDFFGGMSSEANFESVDTEITEELELEQSYTNDIAIPTDGTGIRKADIEEPEEPDDTDNNEDEEFKEP